MILPETLLQDLRYGARMLSRNVGFTAVAVLALALGIGVNTAVFTAYKAMVARPLDARDPGKMVNLALTREAGTFADFTFSYPDYEAYRDSVHSLRDVIAFNPEHLTLSNAGGFVSQRAAAAASRAGRFGLDFSGGATNAEFASTFVVSENYFTVLGVAPARGRSFESMSIPDLLASPSVLISENYWQRRFAGDAAVIGRTIHLNGAAFTIIGITPRDFTGTGIAVPAFWLPATLAPLVHGEDNRLHNRETQWCRLFARLAAGSTIPQAQAEMTLVADRLRALHDPHSALSQPNSPLVWPGSPFPLPLKLYPGLIFTIVLIMAAAAMLLAVACANVGSLQLARAQSRQSDLHTRLSLGASRQRIVRQLLTESVLLSVLAGGVALFFTWSLLKVAVKLTADALPPEFGTLIFDVAPDAQIFAYVFGISLLAGIVFGLFPAMESSRSALSSAVRGSTLQVRSRRLQNVLVATQVALSLVLMIAGSMLIRSSMRSLNMETGYDGKHIIQLTVQFPESSKYPSSRKITLVRELRTRLAALPGVMAITSAQPPDGISFRTSAVPLDSGNAPTRSGQSLLSFNYVQSDYFQTLGIPLLLGSGFQIQTAGTEQSIIVSDSAAKQMWPGQNPIDRVLRLGPVDEHRHSLSELIPGGPAYRVVGVARDTRGVQFDGSDTKKLYLLSPEDKIPTRPILLRTKSDPAGVINAIDPVIAGVDPELSTTTTTLDALLRTTAPFVVSSLAAAVASTVGLLGLLLASMGIYGTVSYIVLLRTREVGIRMAIGAQKRDILGLMLLDTTRPVIAGLLAGILLALGASYLLHGVFYGLNAVDGISFAGVSLLFLAVAMLAAYPPSRRAMRVDPMVALRYE
jgi:predicted permease